MHAIIVLSVSVVLQLLTVFIALRLMRTVGGRLAWLALSSAIFLMAVRRAISLNSAIDNFPYKQPLLETEIVALAISILMLVGVISIRPIFEMIRKSKAALDEQTSRNKIILGSSPDGFCVTSLEGTLVEVNDAMCKILGYQENELLSMNVFDFEIENSRIAIEDRTVALLVDGQNWYETRFKSKNADMVDLDVTSKYVAKDGQRFIYLFLRDITEKKRTEAAYKKEHEQAAVTLEAIGDGVITVDANGMIQYMNPVAEQLCGIPEKLAYGKVVEEVINIIDEKQNLPLSKSIPQYIAEEKHTKLPGQLLVVRHSDGGSRSVEITISPVHDTEDTISGCVLVMHDITELRDMARELSHLASHDSLTGLINRRQFEINAEELLKDAKTNESIHALCYLDLDQFKVVNDTSGHIAGDNLLKKITKVLQKSVRREDSLARLGGDEFGVLIEHCGQTQAYIIAEKLRQAVKNIKFAWQDKLFETSVSIGLVMLTHESGSLTDILSASDSACYVAKEQGGNRVHAFKYDDTALAERHGEMQWMQRIQRALIENRFKLFYQPIKPIDTKAGLTGYSELLIRMIDEHDRCILPNEFMPAAERYHLMPTIDRWVISRALEALSGGKQLMKGGNTVMGINLSGQSLGDETFLPDVLRIINDTNTDPKDICFEITETAVIANMEYALKFIHELREMGCLFALDDFGSGLSSFSYLKELPVDYLKIDGSFVRTMLDDEKGMTMVKSIHQIGHVMGIHTIAEYVESEAIMKMLQNIGVDFVQGFAVAKPVPLLM
ncbi:MAG: hypothetical protein BMS9Abin15_0269 [Gammaproteobacteria bacterium]|nr:MAG: hypothetical protein BMS9Abin15_0269 [Gammaproteobacteria bacterium]